MTKQHYIGHFKLEDSATVVNVGIITSASSYWESDGKGSMLDVRILMLGETYDIGAYEWGRPENNKQKAVFAKLMRVDVVC